MCKAFRALSAITICPKLGRLTVLVLGLASCKQEVRTADQFNPPLPLVHHSASALTLKDWNGQADHHLDLDDSVDFSVTGATAVDAKTTCLFRGARLESTVALPSPTVLKMYQIVPDEVLAQDLASVRVECDSDFSLRNANGSIHTYGLRLALLTDVSDHRLRLVMENPKEGGKVDRRPLNLTDLRDLRLRYSSTRINAARLSCTDIVPSPLLMASVLDASLFDLVAAAPRPGRPANIMQQHFTQMCRAVVEAAGLPADVSELFSVQLERGPVQVTLNPPGLNPPSPAIANERIDAFVHGEPATVLSWTVTNPNPFPRYLRLYIGEQTLAMIYAIQFGPLKILPLSAPWLHLEVKVADQNLVGQSDQRLVWLLPPGESVTVRARVTPTEQNVCDVRGLLFRPLNDLHVEELGKSGRPLRQTLLPFDQSVIWTRPGLPPSALSGPFTTSDWHICRH